MEVAWIAVSVAFSELPRALGHSLWQGAVIALVVYAILRGVPAGRANLRYIVPVLGLCVLVVAVIVTWSVFGDVSSGVSAKGSTAAGEYTSRLSDSVQASLPPPEATSPPVVHSTVGGGSALGRLVLQCWTVGVVLMLLRLSWMMAGVGALRRQSRLNEDVALAALLEEMKALMRVPRRVALRVSDHLMTPVAMGLILPAIVVPTSFVTGVPPQQLRAILAHELAHIRRYDYLVNFFQLMIESLLYFNPAVWWLSRQIRIEREACCDAIAARALGDALDYADALAWVTRYVHDGHLQGAAQAFGAPSHSERMLDRIRRLLMPEYRPHVRLRWHSVALGTLLSVAILAGLFQSAVLAKRFLSDDERIAVMAELADTYQTETWQDERATIPIAVVIDTFDGAPLPDEKGHVKVMVQVANGAAHYGLDRDGDRFRCRVRTGEAFISAEFPGYAPAVLGPIQVEEQGSYEDLHLTLQPNHPATVRFVTEDGAAIEGVDVRGGYQIHKNSWSGTLRVTSDERGEVQVPQSLDPIPVALTAKAAGFQESNERDLELVPDGVVEWVLYPDEPVSGVVVAKATGRPVTGARIARIYDSTGHWPSNDDGDLVAVTDAQGQFVLGSLVDNRRYFFLAHAAGYGSALFVVDAGQDDPVRVSLAPRYVRGVVRGDLSLLDRDKEDRFAITYSMPLHFPGEGATHFGSSKQAPVEVIGGVGHFVIPGLRAGELYIQAGPEKTRVNVSTPVEDLQIELRAPGERPERMVVVDFPVPEGAPSAEGVLQVVNQEGPQAHREQVVPIQNGRADFMVDVPNHIRIGTIRLNGYIPKAIQPENKYAYALDVRDEKDPLVLELPLERAGAIEGLVLHADGTPAGDALVSVVDATPGLGSWPEFYPHYFNFQNRPETDGRFAVLPVPLGKELVVKASVGFARTEERVVAETDNPIISVQLKIPAGVDVPVLVVDPRGAPMPETEVAVEYLGGSHSGLRTDENGIFMLRGADPNAEFSVEARPTRDYQYTAIKIPFDGTQPVIRLTEGMKASGVVQRNDTGEGVPYANVVVRAAYDPSAREYRPYDVETIADGEGKFTVTNLREGRFTARANGSGFTGHDLSETEFTAGQSEVVVIQLRPESGSWQAWTN